MKNITFDNTLFYDAIIEEILSENTLRLAIIDHNTKIIKLCMIDKLFVGNELKKLFILDLIKTILPIGNLIKIKIDNDQRVTIFNKELIMLYSNDNLINYNNFILNYIFKELERDKLNRIFERIKEQKVKL